MRNLSLSLAGNQAIPCYRGATSPNIFSDLLSVVSTWRARRAWRLDLRRLDDHMLSDIGLGRAEAEMEIAKPFWRA